MAATLSSSLPFPTMTTHSIPSLHSAFVTSVAPSHSFRGKGLCFLSARKVFAHFPGRSFRTNRLSTWAAEDEEANPVEETPGDGGDGGGEGSAEQPTVSVPVSSSDTLTMFFQPSYLEGGRKCKAETRLKCVSSLSDSAESISSSSNSVEFVGLSGGVLKSRPRLTSDLTSSFRQFVVRSSHYYNAEGVMSDSAVGIVTKALEGTEGITDLKVQIIEGIGSVELIKQTTIQATGVASSLVETIQGAGFKLQTLNLSFEEQEEVLLS